MIFQLTIPLLEQLNAPAHGGGVYNTDLGSIISSIVSLVLTLASIATFFYLAWGGLNWVLSSGDKGKVEEARNRILNAMMGLMITAASWAIFLVANYFFGLNIATGAGGGASNSGSGSAQTCAANIAIGSCGRISLNGPYYRCLPANSPCEGNTAGYPYPYLCQDNSCP